MHLEKIAHAMTTAAFREKFPTVPITHPEKKDYSDSMWEEVREKRFATFNEKISGRDVLYQLIFKTDKLVFLQVSLNGEFSQESYNDIMAIGRSIIAGQKDRGIDAPLSESAPLAWKELIESPLPETGHPYDRYINVYTAKWPMTGWQVLLSYTWTWPGQLYLEYREEMD